MKCLILAAGRGKRLRGEGDSKPLVTVAGLPLIERTIATAQRAGFTDFYVVTGYSAPALEAFLSDLTSRRNVSITPIRNSNWEAGNGTSLLAARGALDSNFILLMADHVFEEETLMRLSRETLENGEVIQERPCTSKTRALPRSAMTRTQALRESSPVCAFSSAAEKISGEQRKIPVS